MTPEGAPAASLTRASAGCPGARCLASRMQHKAESRLPPQPRTQTHIISQALLRHSLRGSPSRPRGSLRKGMYRRPHLLFGVPGALQKEEQCPQIQSRPWGDRAGATGTVLGLALSPQATPSQPQAAKTAEQCLGSQQGRAQRYPQCQRPQEQIGGTQLGGGGGAGNQTKEAQERKRKKKCICQNKEQAQLETAKFQLGLITSPGLFCQLDPHATAGEERKTKEKRGHILSSPPLHPGNTSLGTGWGQVGRETWGGRISGPAPTCKWQPRASQVQLGQQRA